MMNNMPNVNDVIKSWSMPQTAYLASYAVDDNGLKQETMKPIEFNGLPLQPTGIQKATTPDGIRAWAGYRLYCDFDIKINDVIEFKNKRYRMEQKTDWVQQGYYEYLLKEDYTND